MNPQSEYSEFVEIFGIVNEDLTVKELECIQISGDKEFGECVLD